MFAVRYFEDLANTFPELKHYFESNKQTNVLEKMRVMSGGHILFRPIGLLMFTKIIGELRKTFTYDEALRAIGKLPVNMASEPYADTVWNRHNKTIEVRGEAVCREVLLYMLGRGRSENELRRKYARALKRPEDEVVLPAKIVL